MNKLKLSLIKADSEYYKCDRVICPVCKGTKVTRQADATNTFDENVNCKFCDGEGIVWRYKHTKYVKINDADTNR